MGEGNDKDGGPLDASVIDGASVKVKNPTEAKPYYTITFSEDLTVAQKKENAYNRLNKALGDKMSNINIKKADFVVEVWECGLFRQIIADFIVNAKVNGSQGDATVAMSYKFYYDDYNCDLIRLIEKEGWQKYLSAANKQKFETIKQRKQNS